jgi:hypothetical protein
MVVTTQCKGREVTGLCVGAANARRYFSRRVEVVDLRLDDLQIQCTLSPDFWRGKPEIHDQRLCSWLKFKVFHEQPDRPLATLAMEQSGINCFTVHSQSLAGFRQSDATIESQSQLELVASA